MSGSRAGRTQFLAVIDRIHVASADQNSHFTEAQKSLLAGVGMMSAGNG